MKMINNLTFQFHTGSIKRDYHALYKEEQEFQFHTGSIKSCFPTGFADALNAFQFHTGSIKSCPQYAPPRSVHNGFNSILVRLKVIPIHRIS